MPAAIIETSGGDLINPLDLDDIQVHESENAEACFRLGVKFMENRQYAEAESCFRRTLSLAPGSLETILNLGYALDKQGRSEEALPCYESVLAADPGHAKARYNRAIHLLRTGNLADGFADYEARFAAMPHADSRVYAQPRWDGSPLEGRSILVYGEQGLGDAIQFCRYIPLLAKQGARVVLEVQPPLVSLLATLSGVETVIAKTDRPPVTDCHIPLLSLPYIFETTLASVPAPIPYLTADPSKTASWRQRLANDPQFRVGIVWRGSATNPMDRDRSCPLTVLSPLQAIPGVSYYSLQVGPAAGEISCLPQELRLIDMTEQLHDFSETAALLANLDLLITVDTAVAHLAGALGKPVWILLTHTPDWRWMLERSDSPWYPNARLFRQPRPGEWPAVAAEITVALRQRLASHDHEEDPATMGLEAPFHRALRAIEQNDPESAIADLKHLLLQLPEEPPLWFNLGRAYDLAGQLGAAEQAYRQALLQTSDSPAIWCALGEIRLKQGAYPEAEFCLRKAHMLKPESIEILLALGRACSSQHKNNEAFDCCRKILDIKPDCAEATYNMAFLQLRSGDYRAGFSNFEARLRVETFNIDPRSYGQPRWDGSPLNGRSILVFGEQGMGDVIQFARYLPLVAARGGTVVFEIDPPLMPLFDTFPGVARIVPKSDRPPLTDVYIQLLSLPHIFETTAATIPGRKPYLFPDRAKADEWRQRLGNNGELRIGLVWRGNPKNPRDKERSCALSSFAPLGGLPNVHFYSLQVGEGAMEALSPPPGLPLTDLSSLLTDLTETAAVIANLDLVICVDTAVAHLAGALGVPVWVLLPQGSEWRWLEGHDDSPWYPSMRVFEHGPDNDWGGVIARVRTALESWRTERINSSEPLDIEARYEQGVRLKESGDLEGAERCFRQIVERHPELPDPQYSLGVVLQLRDRLPEAIGHYQEAIALDPGFVQAHFNLANAFLRSALYQDAIEAAQTALRHNPGHADAHWLLGMLLLQAGDFTHGWREYEWRWKAAEFTSRIPDLDRHQWDGSPLHGKTLLIHMEQGRGDMIQFIRYAPLAVALGGRVIACALPELVPLLTNVEGLDLVVDREQELPDFDLHIPVQSLPYVFGTTLETIPHTIPYLRPEPGKTDLWQRIFPEGECLRIGLAWQGTPTHKDDHNRSCTLHEFLVLGTVPGVEFYSLQIGAGAEQIHDLPAGLTIVDATGRIRDFSDTAGIIAHLDLVISVDTAVAHLAGAMGKPVWTLLPYVPEWRWLLDRDDTPWYPTMRLFRQTSPADWKGVFSRLCEELELLIGRADRLNRLGIVLLRSGSAARASQAFTRALACETDKAESLCNRGVALVAQGRYEDALVDYQDALAYKSEDLTALYNMGNLYVTLNKPDQARACYQLAIELKPDFVAAHLCLGEVAKHMGDFTLARMEFERAAALDSRCADAFQGLAEVYQAEEHYEEAIVAYHRALELKPGSASALNMMGTAYQSLEQLDAAEGCYRQALALTPNQQTLLNNLAVVLNAQGRLEEAVAVYRRLLQVDPDYADGHWNLAVALLSMGAYPDGWREFEWRFKKTNPVPTRPFPQPLWDGSGLAGQTILLHAEQGFGDTFQFARYVPLLAQRGAKVIIECQLPALKELLRSLDGITDVVAFGEPLPHFDCHLPLMSLPLLFGTTLETIPGQAPYLAADPHKSAAWRQRLGSSNKFKVGLVWYAKQSQILNRKRSCALTFFSALWQVWGVEFYTLQIGIGTEQLEAFAANHEIIDLTNHISEFADTAAFIANLDLVITIDTAVAHLAGALGARTWVILPYVAEWRWLCGREDSPWYPSMRLFRQSSQGDWAGLMNTVADALQECVQVTDRTTTVTPVDPKLRVGLAWSGRQDNPINCKRSCPFSALAPLFDLQGITFVSLQVGSTDAVDASMIDLGGQLHDFEDTAAVMAQLDLIISIDTSVAHLAAATGRPTWVLLAHVADWRWAKDQTNKPSWYPAAELFQQADFGDWDGVIREVAERLSKLSGNPRLNLPSKQPASENFVSGERCRLERLLQIKQQELSDKTTSPDAHLDLGATLALLGRDMEAADVFRRVLELDPAHVAGHLNLAYSLLAIGNYAEGWEHLEWRLKRLPPGQLPPWPMLHKSSLGIHPLGTSLLVHCEQGFGDTILFARFLPLLAEEGYRVIVSCQPAMTSLVASIPGVSQVVSHGESLPLCDLQTLLLSLPWLLSLTRASLPDDIPYLVPTKERLQTWETLMKKKFAAV